MLMPVVIVIVLLLGLPTITVTLLYRAVRFYG